MNASTASTTTENAPPAACCSEPIPGAFLRRVWERMAAIYPNRWRAAMGDSPNSPEGGLTVYGDTWAKGLAGLRPDEIARGLEACITRSDPWPPVLAEFRALCLAIPSMAQVREDLTREHADREPFTIMVARRLDGHRYRTADAREAERLLREAYDDAREARMRGEPLPEPLLKVAHDPAPPTPAPREVAQAYMDTIRRELGMVEQPAQESAA